MKFPGRIFGLGVLILGATCVGIFAAGPAAEDFLPVQPPPTKYNLMAGQSPFSPPTAAPSTQATPTPPPPPAWSDSLSVKGVMQNGTVYVAIVEDTNNPHHYSVRSDREDTDSHLTLVSVKWPSKADQPVVTVRRGAGELAQLKYEPTTSGSSVPPGGYPPPIPGGARPMMSVPGGVSPTVGGLRPPIPGNAGLNPPGVGVPGVGVPGSNLPRGAVIRRPIIQASPPPVARGALNRPVLANPGAAKPGVGADDDDDDD